LRGRLHEAERRFDEVKEPRAHVRGDTLNIYQLATFHATVDGLIRGDAARGLAELDAAVRAAPDKSPMIGTLQLAATYAFLGNPARARDILSRYLPAIDTLRRRGEAVPIARTLGAIAMAEGKTDSAVAYFRRGDFEADGLPSFNCAVCTPYFIGIAFDRGGRADSARKYLTAFVEGTGSGHVNIDPNFLGPTLLRLGQLYEAAGDAKHALEYYGRFVDLWAHADPELQARVTDARAHIAQLNRAKG
jgi:tetratricopeptide (TPR) repeat protein